MSEDKKSISVLVETELVDEVDQSILKAKAEGDLPMDFSRSDAIRQFLQRVAENPSILYED